MVHGENNWIHQQEQDQIIWLNLNPWHVPSSIHMQLSGDHLFCESRRKSCSITRSGERVKSQWKIIRDFVVSTVPADGPALLDTVYFDTTLYIADNIAWCISHFDFIKDIPHLALMGLLGDQFWCPYTDQNFIRVKWLVIHVYMAYIGAGGIWGS